MRVIAGVILLLVVSLPAARQALLAGQDSSSEGEAIPSPETRAIAYLAQEVPLWSKENHCFSCHNNGDGARALYTARRLSYAVPESSLTETTRWLTRPLEWDDNRGEPGFSDKRLARIQFAASLVEAFEAGLIDNRERFGNARSPAPAPTASRQRWRRCRCAVAPAPHRQLVPPPGRVSPTT